MLQQPPAILQEMRLDRRIDVEDPADLESWARYFGVTSERLREAVRSVGTNGDYGKLRIPQLCLH